MLCLECHFLQEAFLDSWPCRADPSSGPLGRRWAEVPFESGVYLVTVCVSWTIGGSVDILRELGCSILTISQSRAPSVLCVQPPQHSSCSFSIQGPGREHTLSWQVSSLQESGTLCVCTLGPQSDPRPGGMPPERQCGRQHSLGAHGPPRLVWGVLCPRLSRPLCSPGHLAAVHGCPRGCLPEHQDHCRVPGGRAHQRGQGG